MNPKKTIRKVLFISLWLCIGGGMLTLLLAAINKKNKGVCKGYSIIIRGGEKNRFIDNKDVEQILLKTAGGKIKGESTESISLNILEQTLEKSVWVSNAEIWFDNRDQLHVTVTEKEPLARLFTKEGNSFYIDSATNKLPLSDKLSARVPVFTGFPDKKELSRKDSALLNNIRKVADYILHNDFWMAQVSQIDITADGKFEMIPVVGNHLVKLGNGEDIERKLGRLLVFYKQVLSKTGFDKYELIDVQYDGQVVASRYDSKSAVDSAQLRRNVEKLLKNANGNDEGSEEKVIVPGKYKLEADSAEVNELNQQGDDKPVRTENAATAESDNKANDSKPARQPRAVMPGRTNN